MSEISSSSVPSQSFLEAREAIEGPFSAIAAQRPLISTILGIPDTEREQVVDLWFPKKMESRKATFLATVKDNPEASQLARKLAPPLMHPGMCVEYERENIKDITRIPSPDRAAIMEQVNRLLYSKRPHFGIIKQIAGISSQAEREHFVDLALQGVTPKMDVSDTTWFVRKLLEITETERDNVVKCAVRFFTPIPETEEWDFETDARIKLVTSFAALKDEQERAAVVQLAFQVVTEEMSISDNYDIIRAIRDCPPAERADIVQHALQLMTPQMNAFEREDLLREIKAVAPGERAAHVEERRRNLMAHGINVHAGDRDPRMRAAIELLRQSQGELTEVQLEEAEKSFIDYLDAAQVDESKKGMARDALLKAKGQNESFGPLLDGEEFSIIGLSVSGREVIGRLWIFASGLSEAEGALAKESMITALATSYYDLGGRVCNQGKTQRLLLGVLQGRLAGVSIDGEAVTVAQAMALFFLPKAHQDIATLEELRAAGAQFCDENPGVVREQFMQKLEEYAELQGIE